MRIFGSNICSLSARVTSVLIVSLFSIHGRTNGANSSAPKQLVEDLLSVYGSRFVRPVKDPNTTVEVIFRAKPAWFADFDEISQTLKFTSLNQLKWKDELLTWNPDQYGGIKEINFAKDQIWFPDVTVIERVRVGSWKVNMEEPYVNVNYKGEVVYYCITLLSIYCRMDVSLFPFDIHQCKLILTPYSFNGKEVSLYYSKDEEAQENILKKNGVWFVSEYHGEDVTVKHLCCPEPYTEIHFVLHVMRESGFYVLTFGVPSVLLSLTSVAVFLLHPESGEKISLCVNNVLVLIIFQQLLAAKMPPTGDNTPIVAYYFIVVITVGFLSVMSTTLILGMYHHDASRPPPKWLRRLLRIKLVNGRQPSDVPARAFDTRDKSSTEQPSDQNTVELNCKDNGRRNCIAKVSRSPMVTSPERLPLESSETDTSDVSYQEEWRLAARKLDKVLFWISASTMILVLLISLFILTVRKRAKSREFSGQYNYTG